MADETTQETATPEPDPAAQPAPEPAPAPAAAPEPASESEPAVDTRASRALARALEQSAAARRKAQELEDKRARWEADVKAREDQLAAQRADVDKWRAIGERIKRGELHEALPDIGLDPDKVYAAWTQRQLTPKDQRDLAREVGKVDPETAAEIKRLAAEQEAMRKAHEEAKALLERERDAVRRQDMERARAGEKASIAKWIESNADKAPLAKVAKPQALAEEMFARRAAHWQATAKLDKNGNVLAPGVVLDESEIMGMLETEARELIAHAERLKAAFEPTQPAASEPAKAADSEQPESRTLTRRHARTTQADPKRLSRDERRQRAYATARAAANK